MIYLIRINLFAIILVFATFNALTEGKTKRITNSGIMEGKWETSCIYLGGDDYKKESIKVHRPKNSRRLTHTVYQAHTSDCKDISLSVSNVFRYTLHDRESIHTSGAKLNLRLIKTNVKPYREAATAALNKYCSHRFGLFKTGKIQRVNRKSCRDFVLFPNSRERYFDIIKIVNKTMFLGNKTDVTDPALRATGFNQHGFARQD